MVDPPNFWKDDCVDDLVSRQIAAESEPGQGKNSGTGPVVHPAGVSFPQAASSIEKFMKTRVRKAVFPVAGMGTRFLPATKAIPKEMLPIVDKPLIQYAVEEAIAAGIDHFIFVTGRSKTAIEDHFDLAHDVETRLKESGKDGQISVVNGWVPKPGQITYTRQPAPKGLGHAVWCARDLVGDEPFAILLADDFILADEPCLKQMVRVQAETGGNLVAVMDVPREQTSRYGVIDPGTVRGNLIGAKAVVAKAQARRRALDPLCRRPVHPSARSVRIARKHRDRRRQRDPAHRLFRAAHRLGPALQRLALRG
jgi:hypothetical protein